MSSNTYEIEYAKTGRASCKNKKCELGKVILAQTVRIGKLHPSPFSEDDSMVDWYHPTCFFEAMMRTLAKTIVPMAPDDIVGWENLKPEDEAIIQPMLDQFVIDRNNKLSGNAPKKPKKPKVTTVATPTSAAPSSSFGFDTTSITPKAPKAAVTPSKFESDKFGLKKLLDSNWFRGLAPLTQALPNVAQILGTFSQHLPNKAHIFDCFNGLAPADVKLVMIKDKTFMNAASASGYSFHDRSKPLLEDSGTELASLLTAARTHIKAQGIDCDWEQYKKTPTADWFDATKRKGALWLNSHLSVDPASIPAPDDLHHWGAVVLKAIKMIFEEKQAKNASSENPEGVVFCFVGEGLEVLKRCILRTHARFEEKVPIRCLNIASTSSVDDFVETIDSFLLETSNEPMKWFPSIEKKAAFKPESKADIAGEFGSSLPTSSSSKGGKQTTRIQLTSLDGNKNLDVGKFHKLSPGIFLLRKVDIDPNDDNLSGHVGRFELGAGGAISFIALSHNPIFYRDPSGTSCKLTANMQQTLERGGILGFAGDEHVYRIDPFNFSNPPTNHYQKESSSKVNSSFMESDDEAPRVQEAKRPFGDIFGDEEDLPPPKKSKPSNPAMDWMDAEDDYVDGDGEYKPPKNGESKFDHIIDDAEEDSDEDEMFQDKRPMCKYGASCYQKNPIHHRDYRHPS